MRRQDPQPMARWLVRRERQGWSWAELSQRSGHPIWKLRYWCRRLARTPVPPGTRERGFVAVEVAEPAPGTGTIEITTPTGYRLQVPRDFDADHLRRVVEALEHRC